MHIAHADAGLMVFVHVCPFVMLIHNVYVMHIEVYSGINQV